MSREELNSVVKLRTRMGEQLVFRTLSNLRILREGALLVI